VNCIKHQLSISQWLEQNGEAERMNRTLIGRAPSMRLYVGMSEGF